MKAFKTIVLILFSASMILALTACGGGDDSKNAGSSESNNTKSSSEAATKDNQADAYRVIVKDESGAAVQGVMIQFCSDKACSMGETDADGIVVFEDDPGKYTVHVYSAPDGYAEDETEYEMPEEYGDVNITLKAAQ